MANTTTCTFCGKAYEAGSEEQANESFRLCKSCAVRNGIRVPPEHVYQNVVFQKSPTDGALVYRCKRCGTELPYPPLKESMLDAFIDSHEKGCEYAEPG